MSGGKANFFSIFCFRLFTGWKKMSLIFMKLKGLKTGTLTDKIDRFYCLWPHQLKIGDNVAIQRNVYIHIAHPFSDIHQVQIGDNSFIGANTEINCSSRVLIGKDVLIASSCTLVDSGHRYSEFKLIKDQSTTQKPIIIEDDVWIGTQSAILEGVKIGVGAIVAAGSLVKTDIPAHQIWGGVPAKFLKNRFNEK